MIGGTGTLAGPGTLTYNLKGSSKFDGRLAEGVKIRKTGLGDWWLSGKQTGTATLEAPEGRLIFAAGTFTGDFTLAGQAFCADRRVGCGFGRTR